mmetsp:Transcript_13098/g.19838  ORF Transcript_13098/g.19838 Transcript_13098/m.19838 type:complete len:209 (-) Transcript_13098:130-756(-)
MWMWQRINEIFQNRRQSQTISAAQRNLESIPAPQIFQHTMHNLGALCFERKIQRIAITKLFQAQIVLFHSLLALESYHHRHRSHILQLKLLRLWLHCNISFLQICRQFEILSAQHPIFGAFLNKLLSPTRLLGRHKLQFLLLLHPLMDIAIVFRNRIIFVLLSLNVFLQRFIVPVACTHQHAIGCRTHRNHHIITAHVQGQDWCGDIQ